jgi:hypothetical protein
MTDLKRREIRPLKALAWFFVILAAVPTALALGLLGSFNGSEQDRVMVVLLCVAGLISIAAGGILMAISRQGEFTLELTEAVRRRARTT